MGISNGPEESDLPEICVRERSSGFIMQSNLIKHEVHALQVLLSDNGLIS